jgi:hypothetical protein
MPLNMILNIVIITTACFAIVCINVNIYNVPVKSDRMQKVGVFWKRKINFLLSFSFLHKHKHLTIHLRHVQQNHKMFV